MKAPRALPMWSGPVGLAETNSTLTCSGCAATTRPPAPPIPHHHRGGARATGAIAARFEADGKGVGDVDVVVLAVPVQGALEMLRNLAPHLADVALITDVGSTKSSIVAAAEAAGLAGVSPAKLGRAAASSANSITVEMDNANCG